MIVLVGGSGSGKSTIQNILKEKHGFESLVSYTTRPPRKGEVDGKDYHFISSEEFEEKRNSGFFAEIGKYREWFYGTAKEDCTNEKVAVLTPHGLRQMKKISELNITSFYIDVPRRDRLVKILQRGDDIEEAKRRDSSDFGQFDGVEDEVDFVIKNDGYKYSPVEMAAFVNYKYEATNRKMIILCDIDGVVDNLVELVIERYNEKYDDELKKEDVTDYDMNLFTKPECQNVFKEFCTDELIASMTPYEGSVKVITELMKSNNYDFYFLTSTFPHNVGAKHEWLKKFFPLYNERMLMVSYRKDLVYGDILIDDCPANMSKNVSFNFLFDQPWNKGFGDAYVNLWHVENWEDIFNKIKLLEEKFGKTN